MAKNIEQRTENGNTEIYVSVDFLKKLGVPYNTIKDGVRNNSSSWQGSLKTGVLYEALLPKYKQLIAAHYAQIEGCSADSWDIYNHLQQDSERQTRQLIQAEKQTERVAIGEAVERLKLIETNLWRQTLGYYGKRDADTNRAEATAKYYFTLLLCERADKKLYQKIGFTSKEEFQQGVVDMLKIDKVPNAAGGTQMLRKRLRELQQAPNQEARWQICLSKQSGNQNASRIKSEENEEIIQALIVKYAIPSQFRQAYNQVATQRFLQGDPAFTKKNGKGVGEPATISESTARNYIAQFLPETLQALHGQAEYNKLMKFKAMRTAPSKCGKLWVMDGTPIDIRCRKMIAKTDPNTGLITRREDSWHKLYLYAVADAANWEIVGYALGETENHELVYQAISSALKKYNKKPQQIMYDNGGANLMLNNFISKIAKYNTPSQPFNPQSKVIEPLFRSFKDKFERHIKGWTGLGIKSKKTNSRANPDTVITDGKALYTDTELKEIIAQQVQRWNTDPALLNEDSTWEAPEQKRKRIGDAGVEMELDEFFDLTNILLPKSYKYTAGNKGISITRQKNETSYNIDFEAWGSDSIGLSHELMRGDRMYQVKIDLDIPNYIWLYKNDKPVTYNGREVALRDQREITGFSQAIGEWGSEDATKAQRIGEMQKASDKAGKQSVKKIEEFTKKHEADLNRLDWRSNSKENINEMETALQKQLYGYHEDETKVVEVIERTKKTRKIDIEGLE